MIIAGTNSGVGKTSMTLALVTALRKKGLKVQTFKVGPDFLDPSYLKQASGRPCYNLDGWMSSRVYGKTCFNGPAGTRTWRSLKGSWGSLMGLTRNHPKGHGRDRPLVAGAGLLNRQRPWSGQEPGSHWLKGLVNLNPE